MAKRGGKTSKKELMGGKFRRQKKRNNNLSKWLGIII